MNPNTPKYGPEYEKYKIWQAIKCLQNAAVTYNSVATYSDLISSLTPGNPQIFIVKNDEQTGGTDVVYYYNGIGGSEGLSILPSVDNGKYLYLTEVPTYASMIALLESDKPRMFLVEQDEYQESLPPYEPEQYVPYLWTGSILLEYNSSPVDNQPTI